MPGFQGADRLSYADGAAGGDGRGDRLIGGAQPAGVLDRHHPAAGERTGEHHDAVAGRERSRAPGGTARSTPSMSRSVFVGRRCRTPSAPAAGVGPAAHNLSAPPPRNAGIGRRRRRRQPATETTTARTIAGRRHLITVRMPPSLIAQCRPDPEGGEIVDRWGKVTAQQPPRMTAVIAPAASAAGFTATHPDRLPWLGSP